MICKTLDGYMKRLTHSDLMISWKIFLKDGSEVYGDYDRPGFENPWIRLKNYCKENNTIPIRIELYMFGCPRHVFFEDENGLDGLYVFRGIGKEQTMIGNHSKSFQTLTVGLLSSDCSCINVKKYCWPKNDFEKTNSRRSLTAQGLESMIFKNDSEKFTNEKVQEFINGTAV